GDAGAGRDTDKGARNWGGGDRSVRVLWGDAMSGAGGGACPRSWRASYDEHPCLSPWWAIIASSEHAQPGVAAASRDKRRQMTRSGCTWPTRLSKPQTPPIIALRSDRVALSWLCKNHKFRTKHTWL